ncbi:MAG: CbrC family protein [Pseudomonadota bacterium]
MPTVDQSTATSQGYAKPHFRFFPNAYDFGADGEEVFKRETGPCHCCGMRDIYAYQRSVYWLRRDKPVISARCIADGTMAGLLFEGQTYSFHDCEVEGLDWDSPEVEEVQSRTPGFPTFNPFDWPSIGGEPMAFMGYGDEEKWKTVPEARAAMKEANEGQDRFPCPYLLIFKEIDGPRFKAVIDPD